VLDVDVLRVEVSGAVTVNGEPMADSSDDRGALRFDPAGSVVFSGEGQAGGLAVPLGTGPFDGYAVTLTPGSYDVGDMSGAEERVAPPTTRCPAGADGSSPASSWRATASLISTFRRSSSLVGSPMRAKGYPASATHAAP